MIEIATVQVCREIIKHLSLRAYSGPGFSRSSFRCLGIRLGLSIASGGASNSPLLLKSLFAPGTLFQLVQTDVGLTYGATTLASGTTPPVGTLSGTITGTPVPLWFKCTNAGAIGAGAVFSAYVDGAGTTPIMAGITPAAGVPVALTGAAAGLSHAWAAGTAALDNVWKATCTRLADQSGNGYDFVQATSSLQPVVTIGLNGKPGLLFDGVDDKMISTFIPQAPGTQPIYGLHVFRQPAWAANHQLLTSTGGGGPGIFQSGISPGMKPFCGATTGPASQDLPVGQWGCVEAYMTNSTADLIRAGSGADVTGIGTSGNTVVGGSTVLAENGTSIEILAIAWANALPATGTRNANRALLKGSTGYGSGLAA